jgi:hypothetical protein
MELKGLLTMPKSIKRAPTYHARLFADKDQALEWQGRMQLKMGDDYEFDIQWSDQYELWHARLWDKSEAKRNKKGQVFYNE